MNLPSFRNPFVKRQPILTEVNPPTSNVFNKNKPLPSLPSEPSSLLSKATLNKNQKIEFIENNENQPITSLLNKTVGNPSLSYQLALSSDDQTRQILLDKKGRLISISSGDEGVIGITHSQKKKEWEQPKSSGFFHKKKPQSVDASLINEFVKIGHEKITLPDKLLTDFLTDSASDNSCRYRLHMKALYSFDTPSQKWVKVNAAPERHTHLYSEPDNKVWCVKDEKILACLSPDSAATPPIPAFENKIEHFSISREGHALVQTNNDDDKIQKIFWIEDVSRPAEKTELSLPPRYSCRKTAIVNKTVMAIDYRGGLQCGPLPSAFDPVLHLDSGAMNVLTQRINQQISSVIGPGFRIDDIGQVKENTIRFIVNDAQDQKHYLTMKIDNLDASVLSAWNVSDSLIIDNQKGLEPFTPDLHNIIDLERLGKITVFDKRPYFYNPRSQHWELTNEERSDRVKLSVLHAGLDGQPWMLKDGKIKKLKIREHSQKQSHSDHIFALHQLKKTVSVDRTIPDMDADHHLTDFAAADVNNVVSINANGGINFHTQLSNRVMTNHQLSEQIAIPDFKPKAVAMTSDKSLLLLGGKGELFSLSEESWMNGKVSPLIPLLPPSGTDNKLVELVSLHTIGPGKIAAQDASGNSWRLESHRWVSLEQHKPVSSVMDAVFNDLARDDHTKAIPGTGIKVKAHSQLLNMDKHHKLKTKFSDRLDSFVFRPTMEWPRPLKNVAYGVQHSFSGREGLKPVYQMQSELLSRLNEVSQDDQQEFLKPLSLRLKELRPMATNGAELKLMEDISDLTDLLAVSVTHHAKIIAQHYGILDKDFRQRVRPSLKRTKSGLLNVASSRSTNLTQQLSSSLNMFPAELNNEAGNLFSSMVEHKIILNHQKESVPASMQRDVHDDIGLIKSRLIHDVLTLREFHRLMGEIETAMKEDVRRPEFINEMIEKTANLRFGVWESNPVKGITDMGFSNHSGLESTYDAIRQMVKAFSKENHGVNVTARTVMDVEDSEGLENKMIDSLRSMETNESMGFTRSYGITTAVSSYFSRALFVSAGATGRVGRGYVMNISRSETGFNLSFSKSSSATGAVQLGLVDNVLGDFDHSHPIFLDDNDTLPMSKTALVGGMVSMTARKGTANRMGFHVGEHEIQSFIHQLMSGELDPIELMGRGTGHKQTRSSARNFNLSLAAAAHVYITLPFDLNHEQHHSAIGRARVSAMAGASVANLSMSKDKMSTSAGKGKAISDKGFSVMDRFDVAAQFALPFGPRILSSDESNNFTGYINPSADFHATVNNRTHHKLKVEFANPKKITTPAIDLIAAKLERYFTDNASAQLLINLQRKSPETPNLSGVQKLKILNTHFSQWYQDTEPHSRFDELKGNGPKAALLSLQSLVRQQEAYDNKDQVIAAAEYESSFKNLSRLDHISLCEYLSGLVGFSRSIHTDRIKAMMKNDDQLRELIDQLRQNPHAVASVSLEFNTQTRDRIEKEWLARKLTQEDIHELLKDRENVRIKAISFTQTAKKSDGFTSPNFILGGSNSASVSLTEQLGSVLFHYPDDNDEVPVSYSLKGRIVSQQNGISTAMDSAQRAGYVVRTIN